MRTYSVLLPVKPYVKKYVQTIEGDPLEFNSKSMLCMIIRAFMENKNYTGLSQKKMATSISTRHAKLEIIIPLSRMYTVGTDIRPDNIILINRFLEEWFERAFRKFITDHVKDGGRYKGYKDAYYGFADMYNIEVETDITYDGLKQMDFRMRKNPNGGKPGGGDNFFSALVPSL